MLFEEVGYERSDVSRAVGRTPIFIKGRFMSRGDEGYDAIYDLCHAEPPSLYYCCSIAIKEYIKVYEYRTVIKYQYFAETFMCVLQ